MEITINIHKQIVPQLAGNGVHHLAGLPGTLYRDPVGGRCGTDLGTEKTMGHPSGKNMLPYVITRWYSFICGS